MKNSGVLIEEGRIACRAVLDEPDHPVQRFARQEFNRLLRLAAGPGLRQTGGAEIRLSCSDEEAESFSIEPSERGFSIHGTTPASLLFGVYAFLGRFAGMCWFAPGEEIVPAHRSLSASLKKRWQESPAIAQRHIFPEGMVFSKRFLLRCIDWSAKNRLGEITISFDAWNAWRTELIPALEKRGLAVTLSGHCLRDFLPKDAFAAHPEWFAQIDGKRTPQGQYCFASKQLPGVLAEGLIALVRPDPVVRRLSIWAEDTAMNCQCRACKRRGFLPSFASAMERVAEVVTDALPGVKVTFLAYNAALAWDMLDVPPGVSPRACGVEVAYWGRDYRHRMSDSPSANDQRALRIIREWRRKTGGEFRILEYYTDIWMLTHLIVPQPKLIAQDVADYAALGVDGLGPLVCLPSAQIARLKTLSDQWAHIVFPNMYFFAAFAWNGGKRVRSVVDDYAKARFGKDAEQAKACLAWLEKHLPIITSFNQSLFRLRFVDVWDLDEKSDEGGITFQSKPWHPDRKENDEERRRRDVSARLVKGMARWEATHPWKLRDGDESTRQRSEELRQRWTQIRDRIETIDSQLKAQAYLARGQYSRASDILSSIIERRTGLHPDELATCRKWLTWAVKRNDK